MDRRGAAFRGAWAVLGIASVLGCSGEDSDDEGAPGSSAVGTEGDFLARYPALACAALETCCRAAGLGYNAALCQALVTPAPAPNSVFDPVAAADCLDALQAGSMACDEGGTPSACDRVHVGTVPEGGACSFDVDCLPPEQGTASCEAGLCVSVVRGVSGQMCSSSCAPIGSGGWVCSGAALDGAPRVQCWRDDGLRCSEGTCTSLGAPGAACFVDDDCQDDAYCPNQVCQPRGEAGATCTSSTECVSGTYCDRTCTAQLADGAACGSDDQCSGGSCTGTCGTADPLGGLGQALLGLLCGG